MSIDIGKIFEGWKVEGEPIGHGSYGTVYKAVKRDNEHNIEYYSAVKVISISQNNLDINWFQLDRMTDEDIRKHLKTIVDDVVSEIKLMVELKDVDNIVRIEDYKVIERIEEVECDVYIRMELLTPFYDYFSDKRPYEEDAIRLGVDICNALESCAEKDVIHRDIKPQNILVASNGRYKLGDFGIAKKLECYSWTYTKTGAPNYMAPEVDAGKNYDSRADLYSLGLVLYKMMNNDRFPFMNPDRNILPRQEEIVCAQKRRKSGERLPDPCNATKAMADVILCACEYNPQNRFGSAKEMKEALIKVPTLRVEGDSEETMVVRPAPNSKGYDENKIDTFGEKRKPKHFAMIFKVFVIVALVCGGIFILPGLLESNDNAVDTSEEVSADVNEDNVGETGSVTDETYSDYDEEQITATIKEAESRASEDDYEGALTMIKNALVTYPESEILKDKENEFTEALSEHIKVKTLESAEEYAEAGDYVSAIINIVNSLVPLFVHLKQEVMHK